MFYMKHCFLVTMWLEWTCSFISYSYLHISRTAHRLLVEARNPSYPHIYLFLPHWLDSMSKMPLAELLFNDVDSVITAVIGTQILCNLGLRESLLMSLDSCIQWRQMGEEFCISLGCWSTHAHAKRTHEDTHTHTHPTFFFLERNFFLV